MIRSLEDLIEATNKVVSLPDLYFRLEKKISEPNSSMDSVGAIIQEDPGLAARLLKLANSAFFGFSHPINTISRALASVGTKQVRDLVLATSVMDLFIDTPDERFNLKGFWRHSLACGLAARNIALLRRDANAESLYVVGLLHDLGRLILVQMEPEQTCRLMAASGPETLPLHQGEAALLGFDHARVGGALLARWRLPENIHAPVSWHHQPSQAPNHALEAAIVHIANIIVHSMELGFSGDGSIPPLDPQAWELLAISPGQVEAVGQRVMVQLEETGFLLDADDKPPSAPKQGRRASVRSSPPRSSRRR